MLTIDKSTHQIRLSNWAAIINECNNSNMTKRAWCMANNINEKQFFYWQRRVRMQLVQELAPSTKPVKFVEVPVPTTAKTVNTDQASMHLTHASSDAVLHIKDCMLEISNSISPELLRVLIETISHA